MQLHTMGHLPYIFCLVSIWGTLWLGWSVVLKSVLNASAWIIPRTS